MNAADWKRLNEMFAAASALGEAERAEFLRRACAGDEGLLREAEALLSAGREAGEKDFLGGGLFTAGARVLAREEAAPAGARIGRYRLVREVGRGGMGAVYEAAREDFPMRVALKVIKRGMDTEEVIRRFEREREVLAALDHPNIARLHDGGETGEGLPYIVMELVEGVPVTEFCDARKLSIEERLRLFLKVCAAVSYAHKHFVVHRDIKPSNILVSEEGEPKLLDFGISKLLASDTAETTIEQTRGVKLMTPEYASPEQVRGERVGPESDIYSLGVLLYELLCGRRPLPLKNASYAEILKILTEREPTAPSTAAATTFTATTGEGTREAPSPEALAEVRRERPERLVRRLRGDLDNIVLKALEKEPARRYQTAAELSEDIERHLAGLPVAARSSGVRYRAGKFLGRNRTAAAFAAALALFALAFAASWAYFLRHPPARTQIVDSTVADPPARTRAHTVAVLPFRVEGGRDETLAADLTETLISRVGRLQELEVRPASAVAAYADKDPLAAGRELRVEAVLESTLEKAAERVRLTSRLLKTDGGQVLWSGSFDENMTDISNAQDAIAERVAGTLLGQLTVEQRKRVKKRYTDNPEAYKLYLQGKHLVNLQNEKSLRQSVQYFNRAIELDPGYALAYAGIADAYQGLSGVYINAHEVFPKAKAAAIKALELDPELAEARVVLAMIIASYEWNWAAADAEFKRAVENNPNYASARHWYARHLALTGRLDESAAQFRRARELDPLSPYIALDSNFPDFFAGNYDRAIEQISHAVELDDNFWFAYWVRGWARQQKGDIHGAIADYKKAQAIEDSAIIESFLGNAYAVAGRREEARRILDRLLERRKREYVGAPYVAAVYAGLGDGEQTFAWLEKSYEDREEWMIWMKYDLRFGEMRKDPRFQDLMRRVGVPN